MLISHAAEIAARLERNAASALDSAGHTAAALVREQLQSGDGAPVRDTGALMDSIAHAVEGDTVRIGSPLPYAACVHDGTSRMPGRPFLADGILGGAEAIAQAMAEALGQGL